ncbi:MAG: M15 family metallopeptidase [Clostridia bacterium]|nr:M15 family metallopeptidase [Clostridia bacterium]
MNSSENDKKFDIKKYLQYLKFWNYIKMPKFLKIDFDKPITFRQQFTIMCTVLFISCILFSAVYLVQLLSGRLAVQEPSSQPVQSSRTSAPESPQSSSPETSLPTEPSVAEPSKAEDKVTNASALFGTMTNIEKYYDEIYDGKLILVNKDFSCHHDGENVESIFSTKSDSYVVTDNSVSLDSSIVDNVNALFDDFESIYGSTDIMIACGYRSYELQASLFNEEASSSGSWEEAEKWVAPPGYSEHQTGYVFDLDLNVEGQSGIKYNGEGIYSWINENCCKYGFILRYPKGKENITGYSNEEWHFRYVGIPHSEYIENNKMTFEEYIDIIHTHKQDNALLMDDSSGGHWCVYYVEADPTTMTKVPVPQDYEYEISGDNYSGFIVTVQLS